MSFKPFATLILLCLFSFASCTFTSQYFNRAEDRSAAESVINQFFMLKRNKQYDECFKLFSKKFWEVVKKDKMMGIFEATDKKLGTFEDAEVTDWQTKVIKGTNPSADYQFVYKTKYKNDTAVETIRLMMDEDNKIRIVSYNINSDGFLK